MPSLERATNMSHLLEYKGYKGSIEFSGTDGLFFGKVLGISDLVSYQGKDTYNLERDFRNAIDDYLIIKSKT